MRTDMFDKLSFFSLFFVIVLLPVFFLPFSNLPIETSKGLLLVVGLTLSIIFWALARFFDGKIILPKSWCLLSAVGVVLAVFLSAFFSSSPQISFFGVMFDIGTFWFIFSAFLLMLMSSIIFREPKHAKLVLFGAILSSTVVLIFQIIHLFLPQATALGVLSGKTDNILGSWNAFGLFAGFSTLLSLLVVEFFPTRIREKWVLNALVILGMITVAIVNFPLIWVLLGISSLIIFVYKISISSNRSEDERKKAHFPVFSFIIIMASLLFIVSGQHIGGILPTRLGVQSNELSPSLVSTMSVTKSVMKADPILGMGPNKFGAAWAMYKPLAINTTAFWDISFNSGSGLLPTLTSTIGALGILAWLAFFILFLMSGVKSIFSGIKNGVNWEIMAFFVLSLYLFISSFFYSTGVVIFLLALAFAGIFIGLSVPSGSKGEISVSFLNDHRKSFLSIFFLVVLITATAATSFLYLQRLASVSYFGKALKATTVSAAEASIGRALSLYINDLYLRTYAQVHLVKLNSIVQKGGSISDADKALLQSSVDQAASGGQLAVQFDAKNYINFQALGSLYQNLARFGIKDANNLALEAYKSASALNPLNPGIKLEIAVVSNILGKKEEAKDFANAALALKEDYIDAYIVLSQIAKSEGDNAGAVSYAEKALSFAPANPDLIKYVDSIKNPNSSNTAVPSSITSPSDADLKVNDGATKTNL